MPFINDYNNEICHLNCEQWSSTNAIGPSNDYYWHKTFLICEIRQVNDDKIEHIVRTF